MRSHRSFIVFIAAVWLALLSALGPPARAADTPRRGGVLLAAIAADAPSLDPHQEETFATLQLVAPCYSTLLQIDPYNYPKVIGDVATEWKIAADGLTYTFKLRQGIRFHDGSALTSAVVKAT
jgi:peptide/nickel transport system substrate-binding protein